MAKRGRKPGGKSTAILEYRKNNPEAKPQEIVAKLAENGVSVTSAYVSTTLSNAKRAGKTNARRGRPSRFAASAPIENLLAAKRLVETIGSVEAAKTAVAQYSKLMA